MAELVLSENLKKKLLGEEATASNITLSADLKKKLLGDSVEETPARVSSTPKANMQLSASLKQQLLGNTPAASAPSQDDAAKYGIIADEEDTLTQRLSANAKERYNPEGWGKFGEYTHKNPGTVAKYAGQEVLGGAADTIEGVGKAFKTVTAGEDNMTADEKAEAGILADSEDLQIPANVQKAVDERIAAGDAKVAEWKRNLDESRVALREATGAPQVVTDVLNMAGQVALMGVTGAAAGGAAVRGLVGASTFGTSYEDATQMGADKGQALLYASLNAIGQGMLEAAGGFGGRKGAETALRSILSEGFEEGAGYSLETALQNVFLDAKVPWSAKQAVYNAFLGALGGGAFAAGNVIGGKLVTPQMEQQAQQMAQSIEQAVDGTGLKEQATTYIDTNPATHTPEENLRISEYVNSTDSGLLNWVQRVRTALRSGDKTATKMKQRLQPVNEKTAAAVMLASGVNVAGYSHSIDGNAIDHIERKHGPNGKSNKSMQFDEDVARIPYVLETFDDCELLYDKGKPDVSYGYLNTDNTPSPKVRFSKKIDGTYYVVEAVPDNAKKELRIVTAYIDRKKQGDHPSAEHADRISDPPQPTPKAPLGPVPLASNASVADAVPAVNPQFAESRYATNTMQQAAAAGTLGHETADAFADAQHRVVGWDETTTNAQDEINKRGATGAAQDLINKANSGQAFTSTDVQKGQILMQQLSKSAVQTDRDLAIELGEAVIRAASDIGRALNIMRSMIRELPGGLLRVTQRQVEKAGGTLSEQDIADITALEEIIRQLPEIQQIEGTALMARMGTLTADMSDAYRKDVSTVFSEDPANAEKWLLLLTQKKVSERTSASLKDKFTARQRINLLLNPKTQVRNIAGNLLSFGMESGSDVFAGAVDKALAKKTGQRTAGSGEFGAALSGAKAGAAEVNLARKLGVTNLLNNRYAEGQARPAQVFGENDLAAPMSNWLNDLTSYLLTMGDAVFSGAREAQVSAQLEGLGTDSRVAAGLAETAGREVTFQNDSKISKKLLAARKEVLGDGIVSRIIMPFAKTPANILSRAISYSPAGLIEGAYAASKVIRGSDLSPEMQRKAATAIGRGLFGSMVTLAGAGLAAAGKASGAAPEDKDEAAFMKDVGGVLPNSIKIGNTWVDLSNIGPGMVALNLGATIYHELQREGVDGNLSAQITEALLNGIVMDVTGDSLWQGILDTVAYFEDGDVWGFMQNAAGDALSQMILLQSFLRAITGSVDKYKRETSAKGGDFGWSVNYIKSNIPGLSQSMPIKYDVTGEAVERYEGGTASDIFNAWLNPAAGMSKDKTDSELYQRVMELYEKEGSKSIFPTVSPYSVEYKGEKYALRGADRSEYQQTSGKEITQQLDDLFASRAYKQATSEQQVDMIADLIGYSTAEAKTVFLKGEGITYEKSGTSKTIEKLEASGVPASATVLLSATDRSNDEGVENSGAVKAAKTIVALNLDAGAEQVMLEHFGSKAVATAVKNARNTNTDATAYLDTWLELTNAESAEAAKKALRGTSVSDKALLTMLSDSASGKYSRFDGRWSVNGRSYSALSPKTYVLCVATLDGSLTKAGNVKKLMELGLSQTAAGDFYTVYKSNSDKYN